MRNRETGGKYGRSEGMTSNVPTKNVYRAAHCWCYMCDWEHFWDEPHENTSKWRRVQAKGRVTPVTVNPDSIPRP